MARTTTPLAVGLTSALAFGAFLAAAVIGPLDTVSLMAPGRSGAGGDIVVTDFAPDQIPDGYSYDGQTVYLAARALPSIDDAVALVPGPDFRLRRVLLPLLASPGGTGNSVVILIAAWNLLGLGLAAWGLADLAQRHGRNPRLGYAATLALAFPMMIGTNEPLAFGLGFAALALYDRGQLFPAAGLLALAGLGRETALVMACAVVLDLVWRARWRAAVLVAPIAFGPALVWNAVLQDRAPPASDQSVQLLGFLHLSDLGLADVLVLTFSLAMYPCAIIGWRDVRVLWLVAAGFLATTAFYIPDSFQWHGYQRVCAPALALGIAAIGHWASPRSRGAAPPSGVGTQRDQAAR